ncbi:hypothetical protein [Cellulomonas gilvus]|uniref:Uncharacterized protein n=1 Tax=Cellulomonas gilvus (strain ATCC 13127 / NRRL B-14078) TaxID=593907 RepID=F8A4N7_CELGA|nr:hypothetical protein [Cellulomonas gilvus]AEI10853.1 protein of unknown function DUF214 [Cellulomonas gilvus ATCC 13127]
MTTFEDLDLGEAFGDFGDAGTETHRRSRALTVLAFVLASVLVVAGVLWLRDARPTATSEAVAPATLVAALAAAQGPADVLTGAALEDLSVRPDSTRLLTTTAYGTHYVGLTDSDHVCLVTIRAGMLPAEACATATERLSVSLADADGAAVVVLATPSRAPAASDGWVEAAPSLYVRND